jgi:hypothetical protein
VEGDHRDLPAVDPRQRGHHLRSRQDAPKDSVSPGSQPAESLAYMNRCWTHQFLSPIARHVKSLPRIYRM